MAIGRALSILSLYDLLANLIPGMAWVIVMIVLFPIQGFGLGPNGSSGTLVAAVIVFGFIAGHILQWIGSRLNQWLLQREHNGIDLFSRTMEAMDNENKESPIGELTYVERSFWDLAKDQFDLPEDFPKTSKLLLLVLSYLETRPATRTSRFQAIHTLHRSLLAAALLSVISSLISVGFMGLGWITNSWTTPIVIFLGSTGSTYVFYQRKNKFERTFLRYVFRDFYHDQVTK